MRNYTQTYQYDEIGNLLQMKSNGVWTRAKGSCAKMRSMLYLAKDLNKISETDFKHLFTLSQDISKLLSGLIKTL